MEDIFAKWRQQNQASFSFGHVFNSGDSRIYTKETESLTSSENFWWSLGFLSNLFFLLEALLCCNKSVVYNIDINVHHIKGAISGPHFYTNTHTLEPYKICLLTSSKHWGHMTSVICSTSQRVRREQKYFFSHYAGDETDAQRALKKEHTAYKRRSQTLLHLLTHMPFYLGDGDCSSKYSHRTISHVWTDLMQNVF